MMYPYGVRTPYGVSQMGPLKFHLATMYMLTHGISVSVRCQLACLDLKTRNLPEENRRVPCLLELLHG